MKLMILVKRKYISILCAIPLHTFKLLWTAVLPPLLVHEIIIIKRLPLESLPIRFMTNFWR